VLYVADSEASAIRVVDPAGGQVRTLVGAGLFEFGDRDGPAASARLQHPLGLWLEGRTLYIADTFNGRVRRLALDAGQVGTVTPKAPLAQPGGLTGRGGQLVVADTDHHRLVSVDPGTGQLQPLPLSGVTARSSRAWSSGRCSPPGACRSSTWEMRRSHRRRPPWCWKCDFRTDTPSPRVRPSAWR
jgi:hypothetical protein